MAKHDIIKEELHFEKGIKKWKELEDVTIAHSEKIMNATDNTLVKTVANLIKADSEKHKQVLDVILDTLNGTITLTPEELGNISALLDEHLKIEKDSITLAMNEYEESNNFVVRHLISYLLADEQKHYKLLSQLNDFKRHLYPYA